MKFKVIDGKRLSIYLTGEELKQQEIDADILKEPERLRELLHKVGEEAGFCVPGDALEIEIIPILDGDLLLSIKKIERAEEYITKQVRFSDTEALILACGLIKPLYSGTSDLYFYDGKYYLILKSNRASIRIDGILSEFGCDAGEISKSVLTEHGKLICEQNCVEMFTKIFLNQ